MCQNDIADRFGVSRITITKLMSCLITTGNTMDRTCSGPPKETTQRQDRQI